MRADLWVIGWILCSLALFAVAAWQYFSPVDGPGLIVEGPDREISDYPAGQTSVLTFAFHNRARHPVQIIGLETC